MSSNITQQVNIVGIDVYRLAMHLIKNMYINIFVPDIIIQRKKIFYHIRKYLNACRNYQIWVPTSAKYSPVVKYETMRTSALPLHIFNVWTEWNQ
jgi:hypothetical protein